MKPSINIRLYPQTQTIATNIYHYDSDGTLTEMTDTRYIGDLEQSYYDYVDGVMNGDIE